MPFASMQLIQSADPGVLRLERRRSQRHPLDGQVTVVYLAKQGENSRKICSLRLLNLSDGGLGAAASQPMEPGSFITVYFPAQGSERGFELPGTVIRCRWLRQGQYELGIEFAGRAAA